MARSLTAQRSAFADHGLVLALETHFEFTTFELVRLFDMCGAAPGGWLGVCLDTMNLLTMLEDPAAATRRILPWVVTTHLKDGGLFLADDGLVSFTAEAGRGVVDFPRILQELSALERDVTLSIEDHGGDFRIPVFDPVFLGKFPDLGVQELAALLSLVQQTQARMKEGRLAVLGRERWPAVCEERIKRDLRWIKGLVRAGRAPS
jgi:sugar phosphate isomerase/epimerase